MSDGSRDGNRLSLDESLTLLAGVLVRAESETGIATRATEALESIAEALKIIAARRTIVKEGNLLDMFPSPSVPAVRYGTCVKCDQAASVNSEGWCAPCFSAEPIRSV